ncbi:MAG: hypothetical protein AW07_03854 [Candidatus Accumulibacter sp. SK-11]|nr:MAG: hypothetical protein AW07_03854 [Candidatus Accumulibacter sp. SK-11]
MVELEALRPVCGEQQQTALPTPCLAAPVDQPFDEVLPRQLGITGFATVFGSRFVEHRPSRCRRLPGDPGGDRAPADEGAGVVVQPVEQLLRFPLPPEAQALLACHLHRYALQLAATADRFQPLPLARDHRATRPVPGGRQAGQALQFADHRQRLRAGIAAGGQHLDATLRDGVDPLPVAARRQPAARRIDTDRLPGLHALRRRRDQPVGDVDQVRRRAVVVEQMHGARRIVGFEAADELDRGTAEGVDVLIVVTDRKKVQARIRRCLVAPRQGADQRVLLWSDVLVFVHQDPAQAAQKSLALFVGVLGGQFVAAQQRHRLLAHGLQRGLETAVGEQPLAAGEAGANQPHRQGVTGQDVDRPPVVADQIRQTLADLRRGVAVVGQRQNAARVLAAHPQKIGDAVDEDARLARTGTGENERIAGLAVVGDDRLLHRVGQRLDDLAPRLRRRLPRHLVLALRQPTLHEVGTRQTEVVERQLQRVGHRLQTTLHVLGHDVDLQHLLVVMLLQWREVRLPELALPVGVEPDGHCRPEHRQPLVEADHLLFVQPEQRPVEQARAIPDLRLEQQIALDRGQQPAERRLREHIGATRCRRQTGQQMVEEVCGGGATQFGRPRQRRPVALQDDRHRLGVQPPQRQAADTTLVAAAVGGQTAQQLPQPCRQRLPVTVVLQTLAQSPQMQQRRLAAHQVGRLFAQQIDQCLLEPGRTGQALRRRVVHSNLQVGGQRCVVAGDTQPLEVVQGRAQLLRAEPADRHQLVGRQALVRRRADQRLDQRQQLPLIRRLQRSARQPLPRLVERGDAQ